MEDKAPAQSATPQEASFHFINYRSTPKPLITSEEHLTHFTSVKSKLDFLADSHFDHYNTIVQGALQKPKLKHLKSTMTLQEYLTQK